MCLVTKRNQNNSFSQSHFSISNAAKVSVGYFKLCGEFSMGSSGDKNVPFQDDVWYFQKLFKWMVTSFAYFMWSSFLFFPFCKQELSYYVIISFVVIPDTRRIQVSNCKCLFKKSDMTNVHRAGFLIPKRIRLHILCVSNL